MTNATSHSCNSAAQPLEGFMASSSLLAIRLAKREGTIRVEKREGRFGEFFAICDQYGTIEVADTQAEADDLVALQ